MTIKDDLERSMAQVQRLLATPVEVAEQLRAKAEEIAPHFREGAPEAERALRSMVDAYTEPKLWVSQATFDALLAHPQAPDEETLRRVVNVHPVAPLPPHPRRGGLARLT